MEPGPVSTVTLCGRNRVAGLMEPTEGLYLYISHEFCITLGQRWERYRWLRIRLGLPRHGYQECL